MYKRWFCLVLALVIGLASLSLAEEMAIDVAPDGADTAEDALIIEALPEDLEIAPMEDLALSLSEDADDPGLLDVQLDDVELAPEDEGGAVDAADVANEAEPTLTLSAAKLLIGIKEKCTALTAKRSPKDSTDTVTWSSSKASVAKVDAKTGRITGVKKGKATITAKTASGLTASCEVTVRKAPGSVSVTPAALKLSVGETYTLKGKLPSGTGSTLTYTSANKKIAKVDKFTGVVRAVSVGTTTITVKTFNGRKARCKLTVTAAPAEVFLPETLTIALGESMTVKATAADAAGNEVPASFTYTAKRGTGKITVNAKYGKIVGKKVGTATLYATSHNGVSTHLSGGMAVKTVCTVNVVEAPSRVELATGKVTIGVGQTCDLSPRVLAADGTVIDGAAYTVASSSEDVVSVSDDGVVTGLKKGSSTVTVTASNGVKASCEVTVVDGPSQVSLSPAEMTLSVGTGAKLTVTLPEGTMATYSFTSSDAGVATVDGEGYVTAVTPGTAVVRVTTGNDVSDECTVTVVESTSGFALSPASVAGKLNEGGVQLSWSLPSGEADAAVSFESGDTSVATVSGDGYVTFVGAGVTKVTARTEGGLEASADVTVLGSSGNEVRYRLFAAYSYYDSLPFVKRNANSMAKVFKKSDIDGQTYSTKVLGNPSKASILSGISSFFDEADDNDVSIVYFCSHGHNNKESYSSYRLSLKGYDSNKNNTKYYLTSKEIFASVQAIRGNVILILDSCYSGTFINDMKSKLNDEDGRIAVLAAASNTRATFYNVKSKSVDFFTFFLLQGLGYNEKEDWWNKNSGGDKGSYPGYFAADKKGNGDGKATLGEFYDFAENCIDVNIPKYMKKSWYWGDPSKAQKTRFYAGNLKKLVIYKPE